MGIGDVNTGRRGLEPSTVGWEEATPGVANRADFEYSYA